MVVRIVHWLTSLAQKKKADKYIANDSIFGTSFVTLASCSSIYSPLNSEHSVFFLSVKVFAFFSLFYFQMAFCANDNDEKTKFIHSPYQTIARTIFFKRM